MTVVKRSWFDRNLRNINWVLIAGIVLLNAYILITPFLPQVTYKIESAFAEPVSIESSEDREAIDRSYNHLVIPKMNLDEKVLVGDSEKLVNQGIWQVADTSTPDQGSNTVLVGHRFSYKDPAVFYHLDKLAKDDIMTLAWDGKLYTYRVSETKIVQPTDVYIEEPTEESILTLYTCHPVWSTRERLVVIATLEATE